MPTSLLAPPVELAASLAVVEAAVAVEDAVESEVADPVDVPLAEAELAVPVADAEAALPVSEDDEAAVAHAFMSAVLAVYVELTAASTDEHRLLVPCWTTVDIIRLCSSKQFRLPAY